MKRLLLFAVLFAVTLPAFGQSNAAPSAHVALNPCQLFSGSLTANVTTALDARGLCNIPEEATAIEVAILVSASGPGSLKLWEYDGLEPSASIMTYGGNVSSFGKPRMCAPVFECLHDFNAEATSGITLTLVAVGFKQPLP